MKLTTTALLLLATCLTAPAFAQNQDVARSSVPLETTEADDSGDITVTGTRVIRDGFQAPTPLQVLTENDIDNSSPTNNIADFVNQLPALAGSIRPSNSRLELSNGQAGINALNLRSLGTVRTLVLVNGRRGEFFINVTNVFGADPILLPETGLAANSTYSDLLGRAFRVGVRLKMK